MAKLIRDLEHHFNIGGRVHVAQVSSLNLHSAVVARVRRDYAARFFFIAPTVAFIKVMCRNFANEFAFSPAVSIACSTSAGVKPMVVGDRPQIV